MMCDDGLHDVFANVVGLIALYVCECRGTDCIICLRMSRDLLHDVFLSSGAIPQ